MYAAIDIGTNTLLLLIAEYDGDSLKVIHEEQRIPRLGQGVDKQRNLSEASVNRVVNALQEYRRIIDHYYPEVADTVVMATSAVRDSANRKEFKSIVSRETGFDLRILSGKEEARWTYLGARSMLSANIAQQAVTLDIGGGSSEVTLGKGHELLDYHSFDVGSVRFTERFLHSDPPGEDEVSRCRKAIAESFEHRPFSWNGKTEAIGVAGTVTSLAFMEINATAYKPEKLAGMRLTRNTVQQWVQKISHMKAAELLEEYPVVMEGRADVFLPGILILDEFLKRYDFEEIVVSTGGIRHGAIIKLFQAQN
ncbi:Ppx/GppA family phosphatase [Halalkalibaculum sp. DA3122]|uniref:Ppx/GppA phosphatase family protein n=1 Tax=unclassified Halalkalibaculum TaxID=2964617 RepID=UPI0037541438